VDVVCLGILVADVIARPVDDVPLAGSLSIVDVITVEGGGCAFNTASTLAKFGLRAEVMGKVGVDPFGDVLVELLDERGVGRTGVLRDPNVPTSSTIVLVDSAGERTFLHAPGANGALGIDELDLDSLYSGRALHFAGRRSSWSASTVSLSQAWPPRRSAVASSRASTPCGTRRALVSARAVSAISRPRDTEPCRGSVSVWRAGAASRRRLATRARRA